MDTIWQGAGVEHPVKLCGDRRLCNGRYPFPCSILLSLSIGRRFLCTRVQGYNKACIGAITLDSLLRSPDMDGVTTIPNTSGYNFFKLHADKISGAWYGCFSPSSIPSLKTIYCCAHLVTKPAGAKFLVITRNNFWLLVLHTNTDYQWDTTRLAKGEALSDEWFAGEFAGTIMKLARTVCQLLIPP